MKKKFEELQKGDKMYYWDHGQLHTQYVHDIEIVEQTSTSTDWYGITSVWERKLIKIKAGPNMNRLTSLYAWYLSDSEYDYLSEPHYTIVRGTRHFSCIEAVEHWLKNRSNYAESKAYRHLMRHDTLQKQVDNYTKALEKLNG